MLFNLESDSGARITGYLVPDAFSAVPTLRVVAGDRDILTFAANEVRVALVGAGRHETGQCGFSIDTRMVPGLKDLGDLELYDAETGILVYRRPQPRFVKKKILRLETHLFPLWHLDETLRPHFQYFAKGIENLGNETVTQLFLLNSVASVFLSGRILYKNYAYYVEGGFETLFLMQDPYEELAERLLVLSKIRRFGGDHFGLRDAMGMAAALTYAEELFADENASDDPRSLRRLLRRMPPEVASVLSNPVVRELTVATPDEMPGRNAVAAALDLLSSAAVVGLRSESELFLSAVADFVGLSGTQLPPLPQFGRVPHVASLLKETGQADAMLEKDLELYDHVLNAKKKLAVAAADQHLDHEGVGSDR